jgi:hypothetical protein
MQLPSVKYFFTNETTHALFYMLVHSLWQGLLLALAAAVVLVLTKKSKPALRYNLFLRAAYHFHCL